MSIDPHIAVLSDSGLFREGLVQLLKHHGFLRTVGHAHNREFGRAGQPSDDDLVLVDLAHETQDAGELLRQLRAGRPQATVVAIGTPVRLAAQASAADGWIEDSAEGVHSLSAVASAVARAPHQRVHFPMPADVQRLMPVWASLTHRERQVLGLVGCGVDNGEIGLALGISERAVKAHVTRLFHKFAVDRRTKLALIACHAGLACPQGEVPWLQASAAAQ